MNINEIFLELNDDFSIKSQSQDPVTPYSNGSVKIRVWAKTSGTEALLAGYKLVNGNTVPEELLGLVQLNVDGNGSNEWAGFIQPSVLGAAAQDGSRHFEARVVLNDLQNPTLNAEAGFTIKEGVVSVPADLTTTFPTPTLNTSYAVVLYESDGITPNGNIWQYRDTDLDDNPITATWLDSGLKEIKVYKNSVVADYEIEEGWNPSPAPIDPTATDNLLNLLAEFMGRVGLIEQDAIDNPKVFEDFIANYAAESNPDNQDFFIIQKDEDSINYRISLQVLREFLNKINKGTFDTAIGSIVPPAVSDLLVTYPNGIPSPEDRTNWSAIVLSTNTQWDWDVDTNAWFDTGSLPPIAATDAQISISSVFEYLSNASANQKDVNENIDLELKSFNEFRDTKGQANGIAELDASGKVPRAQLPDGIKVLKGTFGSGLSTTGGDLPSTGNIAGDTYICDMNGYVSAEASLTFDMGDFALYDSTGNWVKIDNTEAVVSVNSKQGVVVLTVVDIANAEDDRNKVTVWATPTNVQYPSAKLVFDSLALKEDVANRLSAMPGVPDNLKYLSAKAIDDYIALLKFTDLADTQDASTMLASAGFNVKVSADGLSLVFSRPDNNTSYGVLTGMLIAQNGSTAIDISAGLYVEVNDDDPFFPITIPHSFAGVTNETVTTIASGEVTYVSYHPVDGVKFSNSEPDELLRRNQAVLGVMSHFDMISIDDVQSTPILIQQPLHQTLDFHKKIDIKEGVIYNGVSGATSFDKSSGKLKGYGLNADVSQLSPNVRNVVASLLEPFSPVRRDGGGGIAADAPTTVWDPTLYDDGSGVLAIIGVPDSNATNIRIYVAGKGQTFIAYGQTVYTSLTDANAAVIAGTDPFVGIPAEILKNAVLRAVVSVRKGATDFSLSTDALFYVPTSTGSGGGGAGAVSDLDVAITSIFENIAGSSQKSVNESIDKELNANKVISLTYDTAGLFKATNTYTFVDTAKATFRFIGAIPVADLDLDVSISLDDGVTTYPLKLKDTLNVIKVRELENEIADVLRDGTDAIVNRTFPVKFPYSTGAVISSTNGLAVLLNYGSPQINEILSVSAEQILENGDVASSLTTTVISQFIDIGTDGTWALGGSSYNASKKLFSLISGNDYVFKFKALNTSVGQIEERLFIVYSDASSQDINVSITGTDEFMIEFTASASLQANIKFISSATVGQIDKGYFMLLPLTNKPYANDTLAQLNNRFPTYLAYGFTDIATFELDTIGVNLFDNVLEIGSMSVSGVPTVSTTTYRSVNFNLIGTIADKYYSTDGVIADTRFFFYDENQVFISNYSLNVPASGLIPVASIPTNAVYYKLRSGKGTAILDSDLADLNQLNEGTVASTYAPFNSPTDNFKVPNGISVGNSQDRMYPDNDRWLLERKNDIDTTVVKNATTWSIGGTLTNTHYFFKNFSSTLGYKIPSGNSVVSNLDLKIGNDIYSIQSGDNVDGNDVENTAGLFATENLAIRVNKTTYPDTASFEAYLQANDVTFRYEVDESTTEEIDQDGSTIQERVTTLIQNQDVGQDYDIDFAQNDEENNKFNTIKINQARRDIDLLELDVEALLVKIGDLTSLNTTDKTSLVNAVNEVLADVGDKTALTTTIKTNLVAAINELVTALTFKEATSNKKAAYEVTPTDVQYPSLKLFQNTIGLLSALATTTKTNIVAAVNEVLTRLGDLTTLSTTIKTSAVEAINENYAQILRDASAAVAGTNVTINEEKILENVSEALVQLKFTTGPGTINPGSLTIISGLPVAETTYDVITYIDGVYNDVDMRINTSGNLVSSAGFVPSTVVRVVLQVYNKNV